MKKLLNLKMIRNDIKQFLEGKNLDDIFLKNRPEIDRPGYRVGKVEFNKKEEIVVWNPETNIIMDYFYDDRLDIEKFDISDIFQFEGGYIEKYRYFLYRNGVVINKQNKSMTIMKETYPSYNLIYVSVSRTSHTKRAMIHVLLSRMFIPKYSIKHSIIDHIDRNKYNYTLSNLKWSTPSENNKNASPRVQNKNYVWEAYSDSNCTKLKFSLTGKELFHSNKYRRPSIVSSIREHRTCYGYYWKVIDTELTNYMKKFNILSIDNSLWRTVNSEPTLQVHPIGLVKNIKTNNITLGSLSKHENYRTINCGNTSYSVHRLIAEVFLNDNKPIDKNLVIDHISTDSYDNRVENLRICTQVENMQNPITRNRMGVSVIDENNKMFTTMRNCADYYKVSVGTIRNWIKDPSKKFNYYNK